MIPDTPFKVSQRHVSTLQRIARISEWAHVYTSSFQQTNHCLEHCGREWHTNQQENDSDGNNYDDDKKKLVKKARHDPNRSSKHDLKNRSNQGLSKQSHSPVYE